MINKCTYHFPTKILDCMRELFAAKCALPELFLIGPVVFASIVSVGLLFATNAAYAVPTHLDISKMQGGCSTCHMGHGKSGTPMLRSNKGEFCFNCHGLMGSGGTSQGTPAVDIYSEVLKMSRHPVTETAHYHNKNERLPEASSSTPRHVACYDCHNIHLAEKGKTMKGVKGYPGRGSKVRNIRDEEGYALCYKCHSDSMNRPYNSGNISLDFDPANSSFHPVESIGRRRYVPSLKNDLTSSSIISCIDCHGNDDEFGPKGPHGSRYAPLLRYNYNRTEGPESVLAYDLCYNCHERSSILNDDSFKSHKQHAVYGRVPCNGCHDAHGSQNNDALIEFDETMARTTATGQINYFRLAPGQPKCILVCHIEAVDYTHEERNGMYCVNTSCPPGW